MDMQVLYSGACHCTAVCRNVRLSTGIHCRQGWLLSYRKPTMSNCFPTFHPSFPPQLHRAGRSVFLRSYQPAADRTGLFLGALDCPHTTNIMVRTHTRCTKWSVPPLSGAVILAPWSSRMLTISEPEELSTGASVCVQLLSHGAESEQ